MTEAVTIVKRGLNMIGAHSEVNPADPELLSIGLTSLIGLLHEWLKDEIDIDADIPDEPGDDLDEDPASTMGLIYCIAVRMAPICRVPVPPDVFAGYQDNLQLIKNRFKASTIPNIVPSRLAPRGQGSSRGPWPRTFFNGESIDDDSPP